MITFKYSVHISYLIIQLSLLNIQTHFHSKTHNQKLTGVHRRRPKTMTSDTTIAHHNRHPIRPPPPSNYHPHYYPNSSTSSPSASIKGCCCCLFLLFSFLALVAVAVVLVVLLAVKPKKPEFSLQQVGVQYINLASTTNPSSQTITSPESASLSLAIRMLFTAKNDNKVGIKYEDSTFNIMYRGIPLVGFRPFFYIYKYKRILTLSYRPYLSQIKYSLWYSVFS